MKDLKKGTNRSNSRNSSNSQKTGRERRESRDRSMTVEKESAEDCNDMQELFLFQYMDTMQLSEEQALQILQDEKYQVHIMVKGLKGHFWPVIQMLQHLYQRAE